MSIYILNDKKEKKGRVTFFRYLEFNRRGINSARPYSFHLQFKIDYLPSVLFDLTERKISPSKIEWRLIVSRSTF